MTTVEPTLRTAVPGTLLVDLNIREANLGKAFVPPSRTTAWIEPIAADRTTRKRAARPHRARQ